MSVLVFALLLELTPLRAAFGRSTALMPDESPVIFKNSLHQQGDNFDVGPPIQSVPVESLSKLKGYRGPLPKLSVTTVSPWVALHSPVRMYIPIRYTDASSANSPSCVQCPRSLIAHLRRGVGRLQTPVPTISICPRFASRPGRVHVAVVSGPRPGQRLTMGRHEVELVVWKADGPVHSCKYTITVKRQKPEQLKPSPRIGRSSCTRPERPEGGIVVCDREGLKHPHGSVCQLFCLEHSQNIPLNSTVSVCEDGRWLPGDNVSCTVTRCRAPSPPSHGAWDCETEDHQEGAKCKIRCDADYVVPTSQLQISTILCTPPSWNDSTSIQTLCQIARRPNLHRCHDRQVIVRAGFKTKISGDLLPKVSDLPQSSAPTCSLQGLDLPGGHHRNDCKATDPELRTEANCSYTISVEESSVPQPHPDDCQNQTIRENEVRTFSTKPTRFLVRVGEPPRTRVLQSSCTPMGDITVGKNLISCHATDPATNAEIHCSFWLTVKATLVEGCVDMLLTVPPPVHVTVPPPLFLASFKRNAIVSCTPPLLTDSGQHSVRCNVDNATCSYTITIFLDEESTSTAEESTSIVPMESSTQPISTEGSILRFAEKGFTSVLFSEGSESSFSVEGITTSLSTEGLASTFSVEGNISSLSVEGIPSYLSVVGLTSTLSAKGITSPFSVVGSTSTLSVDGSTSTLSVEGSTSTLTVEGLTSSLSGGGSTSPLSVEASTSLSAEGSTSSLYVEGSTSTLSAEGSTSSLSGESSISPLSAEGPTLFSSVESTTLSFYLENFASSLYLESSIPSLSVDESTSSVSSNGSTLTVSIIEPSFTSFKKESTAEPSTESSIYSTFPPNLSTDQAASKQSIEKFTSIVTAIERSTAGITTYEETCGLLQPPVRGSLACTQRGYVRECRVTCDPGFGLSGQMEPLLVSCEDGLWDFQTDNQTANLPDCLAQMESSAVKVWMGFEASASHCDEDIERQVEEIVSGLCPPGTDCEGAFTLNCTVDEESDTVVLYIGWTVQADFEDPEDDSKEDEIPEAETRLEAALERVRSFLSTGEVPGLHLFRDSFRRGPITLVCPDGFTADMMAAKCVRCPPVDDHQSNVRCPPCGCKDPEPSPDQG